MVGYTHRDTNLKKQDRNQDVEWGETFGPQTQYSMCAKKTHMEKYTVSEADTERQSPAQTQRE